MLIFLDSINFDGIQKFASILDGITTNPLILSQSFKNKNECIQMLNKVSETYPDFLISVQVKSQECVEIVKEAQTIARFGPNFLAKIPLTFEGMKAIEKLNGNVRINATLCFSAFQAKLAEEFGAEFISVFLGRMEEDGYDIEEFSYEIREIITKSNLLAASIRTTQHLEIATKCEYDAITVGEKVLTQAFNIPLLEKGAQIFAQTANISFL